VNPSGKLAFTIPHDFNELNISQSQYPGDDNGENSTYTEKHHFGYRWYDQYNKTPAYEFGFGMSYSKFEYFNLKVYKGGVYFEVKNVGKRVGSEVAQVYVSVPETENFKGAYRSPKNLAAFTKIMDMKPGEVRKVELVLPKKSFSYWSVEKKQFVVERGLYKVLVGASSRDMRLKDDLKI